MFFFEEVIRNMAGLKNGPDLHGEGLAARVALVPQNALGTLAIRANRGRLAIRGLLPTIGDGLVMKVFVG